MLVNAVVCLSWNKLGGLELAAIELHLSGTIATVFNLDLL